MEKVNNLLPYLDTIPINLLINKIVTEFSFYEALITVGNINESIIRLDYLEDLSLNLSKLGYTYLDLIEYFNKMSETNADIKYSLNKDIKNSVKIMTIHKSKGLEYHICYYTGLTNKFNFQDAKKDLFLIGLMVLLRQLLMEEYKIQFIILCIKIIILKKM